MSNKQKSNKELREKLREGYHEVNPEIAQRWAFSAWLRQVVPETYRRKEETADCISAIRGFRPVRADALEGTANLAYGHYKKYFPHAFGGKKAKPCLRCLRVLSAMNTFQLNDFHNIAEPTIATLGDFESTIRIAESRQKRASAFTGDDLYLVGLDFEAERLRARFYSAWSLSAGKETLSRRIQESGFTSLGEILEFSAGETYHIDGKEYIRARSKKGNAVIEIISR